jgi:hypothetical protein
MRRADRPLLQVRTRLDRMCRTQPGRRLAKLVYFVAAGRAVGKVRREQGALLVGDRV